MQIEYIAPLVATFQLHSLPDNIGHTAFSLHKQQCIPPSSCTTQTHAGLNHHQLLLQHHAVLFNSPQHTGASLLDSNNTQQHAIRLSSSCCCWFRGLECAEHLEQHWLILLHLVLHALGCQRVQPVVAPVEGQCNQAVQVALGAGDLLNTVLQLVHAPAVA